MQNLNLVPEPLWWLLGAIISFYFGAREAHYFRTRPVIRAADAPPTAPLSLAGDGSGFEDNAALRDWAAEQAAR